MDRACDLGGGIVTSFLNKYERYLKIRTLCSRNDFIVYDTGGYMKLTAFYKPANKTPSTISPFMFGISVPSFIIDLEDSMEDVETKIATFLILK